ncbi:iron chelate uptake ABC transporter family permease subunit [bacterium]|nr:iron chelate uptake ABC transporter family permease subunit [bacterium]
MGRLSVLLGVVAVLGLAAGHGGWHWDYLTHAGECFAPREIPAVILCELRLPRVVLAMVIGAGLALAGAAMQGYARTPLAEPGVAGVSAGAALGGVAGFYYLSGFMWAVPLLAIAGALLAVLLVLAVAGRMRGAEYFLLAGIGISSLCGAGVALLLSLAPNPFALADITYWLMGGLANRSWQHVWLAVPGLTVGMAVLFGCRHALAALSLGEDVAASLGVSEARMRWRLALGTALVVGSAVAVSGMIGFVGLVVPAMVRQWYGEHPARVMLPSALTGAVLLGLADMAVRVWPLESGEMRLGVVTALLGAPVFLWLLLRRRA